MSLRESLEASIVQRKWLPPERLTGAQVKELPEAYQRILRGDIKRLLVLFEAWDENNDGSIQPSELKRAMEIQQKEQPTAAAFRKLWRCLDPSNSGKVAIEVFHKALLQQFEAVKAYERELVEKAKRIEHTKVGLAQHRPPPRPGGPAGRPVRLGSNANRSLCARPSPGVAPAVHRPVQGPRVPARGARGCIRASARPQ